MAGLAGLVKKLVGTKADLVRDVSAAGGGAAGLLATHFLLPMTDGLPLVGGVSLRGYRQAVLGLVMGRAARMAPIPGNRDAFASGVTGAVAGHAVASIVAGFLGRTLNSGLSEVLPEESFGASFNIPQVGPMTDQLQLPSASELAEVLPEEQFAAVSGLSAQPVDVNSLGSWIGALNGVA